MSSEQVHCITMIDASIETLRQTFQETSGSLDQMIQARNQIVALIQPALPISPYLPSTKEGNEHGTQQPAQVQAQSQGAVPKTREQQHNVKQGDMEFQILESNRTFKLNEHYLCIQCMKEWGLHFRGENNEDVLEFIENFKDFCTAFKFPASTILATLPYVLENFARTWFRTIKDSVRSLEDFVGKIKYHFSMNFNDIDLWDELKHRTQEVGEPIVNYVTCFKTIVNHFKTPPSLQRQVKMAVAQLHPEYRGFMFLREINSFDDLIKYGKSYEKMCWDVKHYDREISDSVKAKSQKKTSDTTSQPRQGEKNKASPVPMAPPMPKADGSETQAAFDDTCDTCQGVGHRATE